MSEAILQVEGLHKAFGGVQAVADVSFAVGAGEMLALIGPNGAGKSTCFNMLNGQLAPDSGVVRLQGRDIVGMSPRAIWRLGVGRTFQITATFASLSVRENVQMALYSHAGRLGALLSRFGSEFGREADDLHAVGCRSDDGEGAAANGAGRAENRDPQRARRTRRRTHVRHTAAAGSTPVP